MKEGLRFVDSDMHIQEPGDLLEKYLDPQFRNRVTWAVDGAGLYDFKEEDFRKAHASAAASQQRQAAG